MESNNNYVLVLEDRTEVKNEQEVGKLSVVSGIEDKGTIKTTEALHSKSKCNKQPRFSWSLIYEKHRRFASRPGRIAPKSEIPAIQKRSPLLWAPQD
ncbi:hypothetical protein KZX59_06895 [Prevotella intermedia]|nr:hypothetical protein [Prevotella intermedia]